MLLQTVSASSRDVLFVSALAVVIVASVLVAFAALHHLPSSPAAAQDASSNADLAELSVLIGGSLDPRFDPKVTTYAIRVTGAHRDSGIDSVYIAARASDPDATLTVTSGGREISSSYAYGILVSDYGKSVTVEIKIVAADGATTKTYTLATVPLPTPTPTSTPSPTPVPPPTATPTHTPTPAPTATPDPLPPPPDLLLSMSGAGLQLDFTAAANRYYSYELLQIVDGGKGTPIVADQGVAGDAPISFTGLTRAKSYFAQVRTCADAAGSTCGFRSTTSNTVSLAAHTATPTHTPSPTATVTPTLTPTATLDPSVKFVEPQCRPAIASGAAMSQDGTNRHGLEVELRYPKLYKRFQDALVMYEDALLEGQDLSEALDKIDRRLWGLDIRRMTHTIPRAPSSKTTFQ